MHTLPNKRQEKLNNLVQSNSDKDEGMSILQRELSDSDGFPSCYLFKGFWIELVPSTNQHRANVNGKKLLWEAMIHAPTQSRTVISVGSYPTRLAAALKAEKIILGSN